MQYRTNVVPTCAACSANPGPAECRAVLSSGKHRRDISRSLSDGTNNVAELMAVIVALESIKDPLKCGVTVTTDSQYEVGVMLHDWKIKANVSLVRKAVELAEECGRFYIHHGHSETDQKMALMANVICGNAGGRETSRWAPLTFLALKLQLRKCRHRDGIHAFV